MSYKPKMILSIEADAKTVKGEKYDVLTGILYLASADTASDPTPQVTRRTLTHGCAASASARWRN